MLAYIVRHGQTQWNLEKKLQGQADIELNEKGIEDAQRLAKKLSDIPFKIAFSSPLKRAKKTAEIILSGRDLHIQEDERLKEITFGIYEGSYFMDTVHEAVNENLHRFFNRPEEYAAPEEGESIEGLCSRIQDFLYDLCILADQQNDEDVVLIATHGAAMCAVLSCILQRERKDFWYGGVPGNCEVAIVEIRQGNIEVLKERCSYI